jgi:hypothetical protein
MRRGLDRHVFCEKVVCNQSTFFSYDTIVSVRRTCGSQMGLHSGITTLDGECQKIRHSFRLLDGYVLRQDHQVAVVWGSWVGFGLARVFLTPIIVGKGRLCDKAWHGGLAPISVQRANNLFRRFDGLLQ